ncbi:MAG: Wzz/FepE/Etk N-terminal domain-containing protein, partial [Methylomonas sp.]
MTTENTITNDDEITLLDIWSFLLRQYKTILIIMTIIMISTLAYILSKPTIYQSKTSIIIGEQL